MINIRFLRKYTLYIYTLIVKDGIMKKNMLLILVFALLAGCNNDSVTNEFNDANGNDLNPNGSTLSKLITKISGVSAQDANENKTVIVSYDANDRVSSVSDGESVNVFVYNNGNLSKITGDAEPFDVEELYGSPFDAFETGQVDEYDNNGNPIRISFPVEDIELGELTFTAEVFYDQAPNPYFYTLKAAGIIDVLDDVSLNFSINPLVTEIVQARMLFPLNNINRIVYKDNDSVVLYEILVDYVYNDVNHPISATVTVTSLADNEITIYILTYTYKQ